MTLSAAAGAGFGSGAATIGPLLTTTGTTNFTAATGQTWTVGGMKATLNQCLVTASGLKNVLAAGDLIYEGAGTYRETAANAVSGSQLSTTYNGTNGSSLTTLGSVITLTSTTGLVAPPSGYYNQGSVVTSTVILNTLLATAGTYTITIAGYTAYTAAWNVTAAALQTALSNGTNGPAGTTVTFGSLPTSTAGPGVYQILVPGQLAVTASFTGLTGGSPTIVGSAVVGFTWTGISGSTLTGVTFLTNNTVTSAATVASSATLLVSTPIWVIGDVDGAQTGQAGQVTHSAFTTNDTTAPSATVLLALAATTNLSFALVTFVNGTGGGTVTNTAAAAINWYTFIDCQFNSIMQFSNPQIFLKSSTTGLAMCVIVDRCSGGLISSGGFVEINPATTASGSADFDLLCVVRNCLAFPAFGFGVSCSATGTAAFNPGGVRSFNNDFYASTGVQTTPASRVSTTIPCEAHDNLLITNGAAVSAGTSGQLVEDHNILISGTPRTNVTAGTGSQTTAYAPLLELGQSFKWAGVFRQFMAPDGPSSPLLGFGNSAGAPSVDWANRNRPSGGKSALNAVGYAELHDFAIQDTSVFPSGGSSSGKLIGPGDQFLFIPVDATSTVITIQLYMSSGYGGSNYAAATLHASGELGTAAQTQTCSSTLSTWQTLTFSAITPSKQGYVILQIDSYDTSGTATVNFGAIT
jgi:hypothetical protein